MLSPGILQMLDKVRSEFGVDVEVVDANLAGAWAPEGQRAPRVLVAPELRSAGIAVMREGRTRVVDVEGREYRLTPLRNSRTVLPVGLLAMRVTNGRLADVEPWMEVLRSAIESDLASRDAIEDERRQARVIRGALGFVKYLASARTEREVADAAIQAAAVWFDCDARIYRRRPGGDFVLETSLPGADVPPDARQLSGLAVGFDPPIVRAAPIAGVPGAREGVVVPMAISEPVDWVLVLLGPIPADADITLEALGRVLAVQMERLTLVRAADARRRFEDLLVGADRAVEPTGLDLLRELVSQTAGAGAALWIQQGEEIRRMAAVGTGVATMEYPLPDETQSTATRQVRSIDLGDDRRARLELSAPADTPFGADAPILTDACASVLRGWLSGTVRPAPQPALLLPSMVADFALRLDEELARAKRFDRDLALVVVESGVLPASEGAIERVASLLRAELRDSDVLGFVGEQRVVVLLVETNKNAVGTVVRRLRDRLGRALPELKVPALALGQAAFSTECATADALLSQAVVNAEAITLPA